jgi:hypothetical protein
MAPRKLDNDVERLERLKVRLAQLHTDRQRAIEQCRNTRQKAEELLRSLRSNQPNRRAG